MSTGNRFPWRRVAVIVMGCIVLGNATLTLVLYAMKKPQLTEWTGNPGAVQSMPGTINDVLLSAIILILGLYLLRHE